MEPHLGSTSSTTGNGFHSQLQSALLTNKTVSETASVHSDANPPQMNKRTRKQKRKQNQEKYEGIELGSFEASNQGYEEEKEFLNYKNEFNDFVPSSSSSDTAKRRRITEDSSDWNLSQLSNANLSTHPHSYNFRETNSVEKKNFKKIPELKKGKGSQKNKEQKSQKIKIKMLSNKELKNSNSLDSVVVKSTFCIPSSTTNNPTKTNSQSEDTTINHQKLLSIAHSL